MEGKDSFVSQLGREFENKYHVHLVPEDEGEIPILRNGWRELIEEQELWFTLWDEDALEMELMASFGEEAVERASQMKSEKRTKLWLCLAVYLEGGVSFTSSVDLVDCEGMMTCITSGEKITIVKSEDGPVFLSGFEKCELLKRNIREMLDLGADENDEIEEVQIVPLELYEQEWLKLVCCCGCETESDEEEGEFSYSSESGSEGGNWSESEEEVVREEEEMEQ